ncbi:a disintegrin and metalloproteinase with thrombospondin motifs 16 [Caerostris darwini]|uniref:A disintegrin and metalloproteinase with thrombospondin motifs 16 n=1 Tax=Caerostris darwini TaxID=1538125 RepID=A0AAV4SXG7_9ARAC|nr:a disintegrin and metalloproteinase with thrombospondin motifs 16 [Caerostris darwini]
MKSFLFLCIPIFSLAYGAKLTTSFLPFHRRLDPFLLKETFNVDFYDEVPEYEIVHIQASSNRNGDGNEEKSINFFTFGRDISLKLKEDDDLNNRICHTKMYSMNPSGLEEIHIQDNDTFRAYQDLEQEAAFTILYKKSGDMEMEGIVGNLTIKPMSADIMILDEDFNKEYDVKQSFNTPHLVIKNQELSNDVLLDIKNQMDRAAKSASRRRSKRDVSVVYPEILLIADYESFASFRYSHRRALNYYSSLLTSREETLPFIHKSRSRMNRNMLHIKKVLIGFARFLYEENDKLHPYDIAILMTKHELCSKIYQVRCYTALGIAYFGGACGVDTEYREVKKAALIRDLRGRETVLVAAHEIGHLLGADHDGVGTAAECPEKLGFVMSRNINTFDLNWTHCSKRQMRKFLNLPKAKCLQNYAGRNF